MHGPGLSILDGRALQAPDLGQVAQALSQRGQGAGQSARRPPRSPFWARSSGRQVEERARKASFGDIAGLYMVAQAKRLRPRSLVEVERHINVHAKPLHALLVDKLRREEVANLLTDIAVRSGPVSGPTGL